MSKARNLANLLNSSGTVDAAKLTDTYMTGISNGSVTAAMLEDTYLTEIADGSVTSAKLASNAVTSTKLANNAVSSAKLDTTYMTGIANNSITAAMLQDTYLTGIPAGSVGNTELASGAAVANLGYTPADVSGDTFTGNVNISGAIVATGNITGFGTI